MNAASRCVPMVPRNLPVNMSMASDSIASLKAEGSNFSLNEWSLKGD